MPEVLGVLFTSKKGDGCSTLLKYENLQILIYMLTLQKQNSHLRKCCPPPLRNNTKSLNVKQRINKSEKKSKYVTDFSNFLVKCRVTDHFEGGDRKEAEGR